MKLEDYLKEHNLTQSEYAERFGKNQPLISKWIKRGCIVDDDGHPHLRWIKGK